MNEWTDVVVHWTARIALFFYVAALIVRGFAHQRPRRQSAARTLWTLGYVVFLLHLSSAFHFVHHWSHDSAVEETARRTHEAIGIAVGAGVYANHLFALVWGFDVAWWWIDARGYLRRPKWIEILIQGYLAFIAFNSTVVFGHGLVRWAGALGTILILGVMICPRRHNDASCSGASATPS